MTVKKLNTCANQRVVKSEGGCTRRDFLKSSAVVAALNTSAGASAHGEPLAEHHSEGGELYWGDLHTHTSLSDGNGSPEDNFMVAKSHLDFWSMADHAYDKDVFSLDYSKREGRKLLNSEWEKIQNLCRINEAPGKFIPFLGYEWTNCLYGHHNVYYFDYDRPINMPATLPELYSAVRNLNALVIPHHPGYPVGFCGKDWNYCDEQLSPFVEMYSLHGCSETRAGITPTLTTGSWMGPGAGEGCAQAGLARGYKIGFIASSDSHGDHPGAYDLGLMGVWAEELTRPSLWTAFKKRRVYAVTGDRISLDFAINGTPMGSILSATNERNLAIYVQAWDRISRVEILKNNKVLHTFNEPEGTVSGSDKIRFRFLVEWGWDPSEDQNWKGKLELRNGRILQAIPCYRGRMEFRKGTGIMSLSDTNCEWNSRTEKARYAGQSRRYADASAFEVECPERDSIHLAMSCGDFRQSFDLTPEEMLQRSEVRYIENLPCTTDGNFWSSVKTRAKVKIHRAFTTSCLTVSLSYQDIPTDESTPAQSDFYYIRVVQENGQSAWSSPIWVA